MDAGVGLFAVEPRRSHSAPNQDTFICDWTGTYTTDPKEAERASKLNHSVMQCTDGMWVIPQPGSTATRVNDSFGSYNTSVNYNAARGVLELHSMGRVDPGEEFALEYGLAYWVRRLNLSDMDCMLAHFGDKLRNTIHYVIYVNQGPEAYFEYLTTEDSWDIDGSDVESDISVEEGEENVSKKARVYANSSYLHGQQKHTKISDETLLEEEIEEQIFVRGVQFNLKESRNERLLMSSRAKVRKKARILAISITKMRGYDNPSYGNA